MHDFFAWLNPTKPGGITTQGIVNTANPLTKPAYAIPHVIVIALIALVAFALGVGTGVTYDRHYYATHFRAPQPVPRVNAPVYSQPVTLAPTGSIVISRYPAVGDQDGQGSCAAFASAWSLSYEYRTVHLGHSWITFSPRYLYDHYSDVYNGGRDGGSWPTQDLETAASYGSPRFKQLPYPPNVIDQSIPLTDVYGGSLAVDASRLRLNLSFNVISGFSQGAGYGIITGIKSSIAAGHPVMIGFPVWSEYDNATSTGGLITSPTASEVANQPQGRGGHENVAIAWNDNMRFPDGTTGGIEIQNQWTKSWGLSGRGWMSYSFVEQYVFGATAVKILSSAPAAHHYPPFVPNHAPKHLLSQTPIPPGTVQTSSWLVHNVVTHDSHTNISNALNYWGTRYNVWPVAMAAVAGTESGINQVADRYGVWPDVSFGLMQFTVSTAQGYGVCSGTSGCRSWLDNLNNSISLAARFLHEASVETCTPWPWLYVAYNAGPGYGCGAYFYTHPSGQASSNFYDNFLPNYNYSIANFSYSPPPRVFPVSKWNGYLKSHSKRLVSYLYHGHLTHAAGIWWAGHVGGCRGVSAREVWYPKGHHGVDGFEEQRFRSCVIVTWPRHPHYRALVVAAKTL